jgi:hypothetical protein
MSEAQSLADAISPLGEAAARTARLLRLSSAGVAPLDADGLERLAACLHAEWRAAALGALRPGEKRGPGLGGRARSGMRHNDETLGAPASGGKRRETPEDAPGVPGDRAAHPATA